MCSLYTVCWSFPGRLRCMSLQWWPVYVQSHTLCCLHFLPSLSPPLYFLNTLGTQNYSSRLVFGRVQLKSKNVCVWSMPASLTSSSLSLTVLQPCWLFKCFSPPAGCPHLLFFPQWDAIFSSSHEKMWLFRIPRSLLKCHSKENIFLTPKLNSVFHTATWSLYSQHLITICYCTSSLCLLEWGWLSTWL